ncbi:peptidase S1 [Alteraurantiacibacter buctensis]|uniref:Peptidase S1 n=1 Tax=Alteraurantiacibacter buctensis TaxID=1503981 RepID=A0A844YYS0_9SPHN|nr:peptidase S1 [Alteraurantiacibacter buctensis]MXO72188.1 peptidase S1 [Alteraurantiacibacter buctensis]
MKLVPSLLLAACSLALTTQAAAQDTSARPTYDTVNLSAGFPNDPYSVSLSSGGSIDASNIGSPCRGFVANAPDVRLNYDSGSLPLYIYANSDSDTTLVVNAPDGQWYCDDDSNGGLNPQVTFLKPQSGQYDIWVGTYSGSDLRPATLYISELAGD